MQINNNLNTHSIQSRSSLRATPNSNAKPEASAKAPAQSDSANLSGGIKSFNVSTSEVQGVNKKIGDHPYEEGELIVRLNPETPGLASMGESVYDKFGLTHQETFDIPKGVFKDFQGDIVRVKIDTNKQDMAETIAALNKDPRVSYAEPNAVYFLQEEKTSTPNDLGEELWGLNNTGQKGGTPNADIDAPEAWAIQKGKTQAEGGLPTAVIDTGVDYNHVDLRDNMWVNTGEIPGNGIDDDGNGVVDDVHGYNAFDDTGDPMDRHSHGTHCAGTIAGVGDNNEGVVGVGQKGSIMAIKIFSDQGRTNTAAIVRGISYASKMGARITSNSWGGGMSSQAIKETFEASPALHIMAAGNSGRNNDARPHYPSNYKLDNNIAVAASTRTDSLAYFSCYGKESVDLAAPGHEIYSTVPGDKYGYKSGTSMATPHVSGAAAVIVAQYPEISNAELKERLLGSVDKHSNYEGKVATDGRLNLYNALTMEVAGESGESKEQA